MGILWFVIFLMVLGAFVISLYCAVKAETMKERLITLAVYTAAVLLVFGAVGKYLA